MSGAQLDKEPYNLDPLFEKVVLFYAASDPKFWKQIGKELDADCMAHPQAKLLLESLRVVTKGGSTPSRILALQRLRRFVDDGKIRNEEIALVDDLFGEVEDFEYIPIAEDVGREILPLLQSRIRARAVIMSHKEWQAGGDFEEVTKALDKARRLGVLEEVSGTRLGSAGFAEIAKAGLLERLPTGVFDLDARIQGLWRGALGVWLADASGGKSMALVNMASTAVLRRFFVGFATLELPTHLQLARLFANLTNVPINDIIEDERWRLEAQRRIAMIEKHIGICEVAEFAALTTTVKDLDQWIETKEQEVGAKMSCLIVDYADRLYDPRAVGAQSADYHMMKFVYQGLVDLAKARGMWVWTASQATRPEKNRNEGYIKLKDAADSMHKGRIADMVITLKSRDDNMIEYFVAKNRMGIDGYAVGPIATDYSVGRLTPWAREISGW
jgi:hypothetical protein